MLGACEVFLTHAGFSGVREVLSAGVPMVAVPHLAELPAITELVTDLAAALADG